MLLERHFESKLKQHMVAGKSTASKQDKNQQQMIRCNSHIYLQVIFSFFAFTDDRLLKTVSPCLVDKGLEQQHHTRFQDMSLTQR